MYAKIKRSTSLAPTSLLKQTEENDNLFVSTEVTSDFRAKLKAAQNKIESPTWKEQNDGLIDIRSIAEAYSDSFGSRYDSDTFHTLVQHILNCANSLRSNLAKEAILTINVLLPTVVSYFTIQPKTIKLLSQSLIPKLVTDKQFVAKSALECLTKAASTQDINFLTHLLTTFGTYLGHCNSQLSSRVCQLILVAVQTLVDMRVLNSTCFRKTVLPIMTRMLVEKLPSAKTLGKKVLEICFENVTCDSPNESITTILNAHFKSAPELASFERIALEKLLAEYENKFNSKFYKIHSRIEDRRRCIDRSRTLPPAICSGYSAANTITTCESKADNESQINLKVGLRSLKLYENKSKSSNVSQIARMMNRKTGDFKANTPSTPLNTKLVQRKNMQSELNINQTPPCKAALLSGNRTPKELNNKSFQHNQRFFVTNENKAPFSPYLKDNNNDLPQLFVPQYTSQFNLSQKIQSMLHERRLARNQENNTLLLNSPSTKTSEVTAAKPAVLRPSPNENNNNNIRLINKIDLSYQVNKSSGAAATFVAEEPLLVNVKLESSSSAQNIVANKPQTPCLYSQRTPNNKSDEIVSSEAQKSANSANSRPFVRLT